MGNSKQLFIRGMPWTQEHMNLLDLGLYKFQAKKIFLNTKTEFILNSICSWWKITARTLLFMYHWCN